MAEPIVIVDIGMGNLRSVANAVDECGFDTQVCRDPLAIAAASHVIVPGVGSFRTASERLFDSGWAAALHRHAAAGKPLLGICLGMQLLASWGEEGGGSPGLDLIPGRVRRFAVNDLRVPHVGWNALRLRASHPVLATLKPGRDFYFVHSYHCVPEHAEHALGLTDYGADFCSVIAAHNVLGTQFHPEKSQVNGLAILEAFAEWDGVWQQSEAVV